MDDWVVAPCLDSWLAQVNAFAPNRSKKSDGSIGDPKHAARKSEHNPKLLPFFGRPLVRARDFTNDVAGGFSCRWFADRLVATRDPRIKYIIWDWRIWYPGSGWKDYTGENGHKTHLHVSVRDDKSILTRTGLNIPVFKQLLVASIPSLPAAGKRNLSEGDTGEDVWDVQDWLNRMFPRYAATPIPRVEPPRYGPQTILAVKEFQTATKLAPDGMIGPQTWAMMVKEGFR